LQQPERAPAAHVSQLGVHRTAIPGVCVQYRPVHRCAQRDDRSSRPDGREHSSQQVELARCEFLFSRWILRGELELNWNWKNDAKQIFDYM